MSLYFPKEDAIEVSGCEGIVYINQILEDNKHEVMISMTVRQFEEMVNHSKFIIAEASKQ